ncbi:uncharacterized protein [Bemisia tabaci]|uniref:uncharacterized protein isoform X2 n=1 Tax=Bemisia tabaci TaxID=7038 RepID=UPI003B282994
MDLFADFTIGNDIKFEKNRTEHRLKRLCARSIDRTYANLVTRSFCLVVHSCVGRMRVCVWFYLAVLFSCVSSSLLRNVETARSTSRWDTVRNLMRQATRAFSTGNPPGSRSSRSRSLSGHDSACSRLWRLLSGRRNSDEEIRRQRARLRTQDSFSSPYGEISPRLRRYYETLGSSDWGYYFGDHSRRGRSDPGDWSNRRVVTYDWRGDIYLITETHFTHETYARILEEAQRDARSLLRFRGINVPTESEPLGLVRTHVAAGLPPHTETPRRSPTPSPVRSPKRGEVDPRDEEAPDTDDEKETDSSCRICMERMIKLALIPCNHEICYTCTQTMSGRRIDGNQPLRSFNCPFCRQKVTGYTPKFDSDGPATKPADADAEERIPTFT